MAHTWPLALLPPRPRGFSARSLQNGRVASTSRQLVGREEELGAVLGVLARPEDLPVVLVLSGDAGIGKTSLWLSGREAAADRGYRVLSARPSEAETRYSFAGLADLLETVADDVLPDLPPVQRRALEAALLRGPTDAHADDRVVAAAFLGAIRALASDGPICLAIDDAQWLDAATLATVRFALARFDTEPVLALLALRGDVPDWLPRSVRDDRLRAVDVAGLSVGATHEMLRTRLDIALSRPTLIRIWETSAGNPFFALELGSALQRRGGAVAPTDPLPISSSLDELLRARLDGLDEGGLEVARVVAALAEPTVEALEATAGERFQPGLAGARSAGILELDGDRVRFTHPLLASAVAGDELPWRRRELHARLAEIVPSAEERARHLAVAATGPDAAVAASLEEAAHAALARGAPATAAELAEQSLESTPVADRDDVLRRALVAADAHARGGDGARASVLLERAGAVAHDGPEQARVLIQAAALEVGPREAVALYRDALEHAGGDRSLETTIHLHLASLMRFSDGVAQGLEHATLAVRAAEGVDPLVRSEALAAYGLLSFNAGHGVPEAEMAEALALERAKEDWTPAEPSLTVAHQLFWSGELDAARAHVAQLLDRLAGRQEPVLETSAIGYLGYVEWRAGNWETADLLAAQHMELLDQLGHVYGFALLQSSLIAAHRGRVEEARAWGLQGIELGREEGARVAVASLSGALGFVELSLGNHEAALDYLRPAYDMRADFLLEPGMRLELGDTLEALIACGELDRAEEIHAEWAARAQALDRRFVLAILARCRGLLLAARGDAEGATASLEQALADHERSGIPFEHARSVLALGRVQRRAKQRGAARATLTDALERFEAIGAPLWADQTRAELARIGGRPPSAGALTEAETRIAALVAEGRTNREVAAALFLTEHSVETALTRVYRKLGVRSRAELTRKLADHESQ